MTNPPNILYLHSHDTGRYIQPYGYDVPTPNLQRLAEQGVLFRQAFCANPTCSPSRAALVTGEYPHSNGMFGLAHRGFRLKDYRHHLVHTLRAAGYSSYLSGIQHVAPRGEEGAAMIGYDRRLSTGKDDADSAAVSFLESWPTAPFFLSVGFQQTHRPFPEPGPEDDPRFIRPPALFPDTPENRSDMAAYRACARTLDARMGSVLDALDRTGLAEQTLVICTTDHGIAFPGMKCNLTDHGIGVMLIMRGPWGFDGGRVCDEMVSQVDLFPTLCEGLGIPVPARLQGRSILPWIRDPSTSLREEVFAEVNVHASLEPMRCVRTRRWKYIRRYGDRRRPTLPNCDPGPTKQTWVDAGWADRPLPGEALYDLMFDPQETCNVADDPAHALTLDDLRGRLDRWMRETGDPLVEGQLSLPAGATLTLPDSAEPDGEKEVLAAPRTWTAPVRDVKGSS